MPGSTAERFSVLGTHGAAAGARNAACSAAIRLEAKASAVALDSTTSTPAQIRTLRRRCGLDRWVSSWWWLGIAAERGSAKSGILTSS